MSSPSATNCRRAKPGTRTRWLRRRLTERNTVERVADEFVGPTTHVGTVVATEREAAPIDRFATLREGFDATVGSCPARSGSGFA
ncbi:hypothetical protein BRD17_05660 [Halobacteriales archaeon SW_7_68_16]|nr:MAG: hypothetical protein BRD17_05660 [Halobacteriales archaeon SW_7_68_16]